MQSLSKVNHPLSSQAATPSTLSARPNRAHGVYTCAVTALSTRYLHAIAISSDVHLSITWTHHSCQFFFLCTVFISRFISGVHAQFTIFYRDYPGVIVLAMQMPRPLPTPTLGVAREGCRRGSMPLQCCSCHPQTTAVIRSLSDISTLKVSG